MGSNAEEHGTEPRDERLEDDLRAYYEGRRYAVFVGGIPITPDDYPPCLNSDEYDCDTCTFDFREAPDVPFLTYCPLSLREQRRGIWALLRAGKRAQSKNAALADAIELELRAHGRPLHCSVILKMIHERYPHIPATDRDISFMLYSCPGVTKIAPGVFAAARCGSTTTR